MSAIKDLTIEALDRAKDTHADHASLLNVFHGSDDEPPFHPVVCVRVLKQGFTPVAQGQGNDLVTDDEVKLEAPIDLASFSNDSVKVGEFSIGDIELRISVEHSSHGSQSTDELNICSCRGSERAA